MLALFAGYQENALKYVIYGCQFETDDYSLRNLEKLKILKLIWTQPF